MSKLRVGVVSSLVPSCDLYRAQGPADVLATGGEIELVKLPNEIRVRYANRQYGPMQMIGIKDFPEDLDVIVFVRGVLPARIAQIIPLLQEKGIAVVVDVDDDYERLPTALMQLYKINPTLNPMYNWKQVKKACRMADMVTCSTPALRRYGPHGRVAVLRNSIPVRYIRVGERIAPARSGNTVGWAGVIAGHPGDLRVPRAGVAEALNKTGAKFLNVGDGVGIKEQLGLMEEPEVSGVVPLAEYPDFIALFDVGIAPLTMNAYSVAKSALKPLESLSMGSCVVASPTPEYKRLREELEEWCDYADLPCPMLTAKSDRREWRDALVYFLDFNAAGRDELAAAGRRFVEERYLMQRRAGQWGEAWGQAVKNRKGARHGHEVRAVTGKVQARHG